MELEILRSEVTEECRGHDLDAYRDIVDTLQRIGIESGKSDRLGDPSDIATKGE